MFFLFNFHLNHSSVIEPGVDDISQTHIRCLFVTNKEWGRSSRSSTLAEFLCQIRKVMSQACKISSKLSSSVHFVKRNWYEPLLALTIPILPLQMNKFFFIFLFEFGKWEKKKISEIYLYRKRIWTNICIPML